MVYGLLGGYTRQNYQQKLAVTGSQGIGSVPGVCKNEKKEFAFSK